MGGLEIRVALAPRALLGASGDDRVSQVPWGILCRSALLSTPAGPPHRRSPLRCFDVAVVSPEDTGSHDGGQFRGLYKSRPYGLLSTLRTDGYARRCARLTSGGWLALTGQGWLPAGLQRRFQRLRHHFLLHQAYPGAPGAGPAADMVRPLVKPLRHPRAPNAHRLAAREAPRQRTKRAASTTGHAEIRGSRTASACRHDNSPSRGNAVYERGSRAAARAASGGRVSSGSCASSSADFAPRRRTSDRPVEIVD